ncbi:MAG: Holliday junction resolvase RuvX [Clostridia bacterium]|nr:Holliday junction resolvase RuvX [Clostridia bacterium]
MSIEAKGRVLGVDYGDVRTGIAISDEGRFLASGLATLRENGMLKTADRVAAEAGERGATLIVVGLPRNMDGSEGGRAEVIRAFVAHLAERTAVPIALWDERLSTVEAHRILSAGNTRGRRRKAVVDTLAAEIILQSYLDAHR